MLNVDDKPETIHLYVVREQAKPSLAPIILSAVFLASLVVLSVFVSYQQPVSRAVIRVPAVPLALKVFTASVAIIPTGVNIYPATYAHGILTITNGSIIGQSIPADFTIQGVATDNSVYVPGGSADGYGWAQVSAHAVWSGHEGNLPPYSINNVIGSSVFIRNLSAFSGGRDSYSVKYVTEQDKQTAIKQSRSQLSDMVTGLHYPCSENHIGDITKMVVSWRCQFITYHVPAYMHVSSVHLSGKNLIVAVWFIAPLRRIWVK